MNMRRVNKCHNKKYQTNMKNEKYKCMQEKNKK